MLTAAHTAEWLCQYEAGKILSWQSFMYSLCNAYIYICFLGLDDDGAEDDDDDADDDVDDVDAVGDSDDGEAEKELDDNEDGDGDCGDDDTGGDIDDETDGDKVDDILANAPEQASGFFVVPKVVE